MNTRRFDVTAIGNAIVDVIAQADDSLLAEHNLPKGAMNLIDAATAEKLYAIMGPGKEASGGSAGNTIAGIAALGGKTRLHRQGRGRPARRGVHARHPRGGRHLRHHAAGRRPADGAQPDLRHAGRAAHDADVPRCDHAARTRGRQHGLHHLVEGGVSRGLSLGSAARQEGDARRGDQGARGGREGVADAVRLVLRRALPRRVPRAGREARGHPVRQRERDPLAVSDRQLRYGAAAGAASTARSRR